MKMNNTSTVVKTNKKDTLLMRQYENKEENEKRKAKLCERTEGVGRQSKQ